MNKIITGVLTGGLGAGVLASYVPVIQKHRSGKIDFWVGMNVPTKLFYALQILAAIGFITYTIDYLARPTPPAKKWAVPILYAVLLGSALGWGLASGPAIQGRFSKPLVVLFLVMTAAASLGLLILELTDTTRWYTVLGLIMLCVVTVFIDAIGWNIGFLKNRVSTM